MSFWRRVGAGVRQGMNVQPHSLRPWPRRRGTASRAKMLLVSGDPDPILARLEVP
jgi:hypothetical protein